jgi:hypothetical protein
VSDHGARPDGEDGEQERASEPSPPRARIRRAPRFARFTLSGVVAGVLIALIASALLPGQAPQFSDRVVTGYLVAVGALLGGVAGAGLGVLADRRH